MALCQLKGSHKVLLCSLMVQLNLHTAMGMSGWGGCLDGQDVFATIKENSVSGAVVAAFMTDTVVEGIHWRLDGKDAGWLFLDERYIRLNGSEDKVLDREVQGPVLMAELLCYEDDTLQSAYRIMVEILNENDNSPVFTQDNVLSLLISELIPVNAVIFTVQATDADNDMIIYSIDETSPDAEYFKVDLPNSGEVILSKPLDYERKATLSVTVHASEMNTAEHFNTSTNITITVLDGDDQYPQFLPCVLLFQDETSHICTSPVYVVNVTEGEEDVVLDFSPGPIYAVDGDTGLRSPVSYAILSGDISHFLMNNKTGEMKLVQGIRDRLETPLLHLQVMAYQDDDPKKYSVATVLVRVLAVNRFYPKFDMAEYKGFVTAGKSPASLVNTYGSIALMLQVQDQDFKHGVNPMIHFTLSPTSNHTDIYQITQEGLLITRTRQLKPEQKHILEVMAVDQESGDTAFATVVVDVLSEGQTIPHSRLGDMTGCAVGKALFLGMMFMLGLGCILSTVMWLRKKHKGQMDTLERGCVAQGKHPNVSLRWFQLLSYHNAMLHEEELSFGNEGYGSYNPSFSFTDKPESYTQRDLLSGRGPVSPRATTLPDAGFSSDEAIDSPVILDDSISTPTKSSSISPTFHPDTVDINPKCFTPDAPPLKESLGSPTNSSPDLTEALPNTSPGPTRHHTSNTPPFTRPDSQNTQTSTNDDPTDPDNSPSSQASILFINTRIASAEIEKPLCKPCKKTPPYSPLPRQMGTPPPTPDHAPFKAKLVHIDMSPFDSPLATPERTSLPISPGVDNPSTSLDQKDQLGHRGGGAETDDSPQERENLMNLGSAQDCCAADNDGFLGAEDADKNNDGENDLDPEEEELLSVDC